MAHGNRPSPESVLHCIPSMGGGGAERQLAYLASGLTELGWRVHVALLRRGSNWERLQQSGARIHQLSARNGYDPRLFLELRRLMNRLRPDIVQVWLPQMEVHGGLAALTSGRPFILSERSAGAYVTGVKHHLRLRMARHASALVSNSEGGAAHWRRRLGNRVRHYVIANALPMDEIAAAPPLGESAGQPPLILFAGRFEPVKNIETLLSALSIVLRRQPARVLCCGDGPLRALLDRWVASRGPDGRVQVTGYHLRLWSLMKTASVIVSPSIFEGRPNVVLEAMACGVPLVVSDIPAHREVLDESSALLVPTRSVTALAGAIVSTLSDRPAALRRAEVARRRAAEYALPVIARQYSEMYREILSPGAAR